MDTITEALMRPQSWPSSIWIALLTTVVTLVFRLIRRPSVSSKAPKWWKGHDWPFVGSISFYRERFSFFQEAVRNSPPGQFSFFVGKKHVVGLSGPEGRKTFFDSKDLSFGDGNAELLHGQPQNQANMDEYWKFFNKHITAMMKKESFKKVIDALGNDCHKAIDDLEAVSPSSANPEWKVVSTFDHFYSLVYSLTMRTVGTEDIANDPKLLKYTLDSFEAFENAASNARVFFPWLPTLGYLRQLHTGAQLYKVFAKIVGERMKTGKRGTDALQLLIDSGASVKDIVGFEYGALYAGQVNSGIQAGWMHVFLAHNSEWRAKIRKEVDAAIAKHRTGPKQSRIEVLDSLSVDTWESEFPLIDLCLREGIRIAMPGAAFRKNSSDKDVPIGSTGMVIPRGSYATYIFDDAHQNPGLYPDPNTWDPNRFLEGRSGEKKTHHGYLGWGAGRHPCMGMKFAKLEMAIIGAYFVASFDFELSDENGNHKSEMPPLPSRNQHVAKKPDTPIYLRYKPRTD